MRANLGVEARGGGALKRCFCWSSKNSQIQQKVLHDDGQQLETCRVTTQARPGFLAETLSYVSPMFCVTDLMKLKLNLLTFCCEILT